MTSRSTTRLEEVARDVAAEWGLKLGPPLGRSRSSYVAPAGAGAVLKVVRPEDEESEHESEALALWRGDAAVRLLRHDRPRKALLLERALPGTDLSEIAEDDATAAAIAVGRRLWREPPIDRPFRDVVELSRVWLNNLSGIRHEFLPPARAFLEQLELKSRLVVHGDFHHHNILRRGEGWAAIDPKPAVGEPEYDIGSFLWNPIGTEPTPERTARRLSAFAAAGLDRDRMRAWAIIRGTTLGLPLEPGEPEPGQLKVVWQLLGGI